MKRYAFIKANIPELMPKIMVVIVAKRDNDLSGEVIDFKTCNDDEVESYLDKWLGEDHSIIWKRTTH